MHVRSKRILWAIGAVIGMAGVAGVVSSRGGDSGALEVRTAVAKRGEIVRRVRALGHVEPAEQVRISPNVSGELVALHVREGQTVERGTLLAEIDPDVIDALVQQRAAQQRLAQAGVDAADSRLKQAKLNAQRAEQLNATSNISPFELQQARTDVAVLEADLEAAKQRAVQGRAELQEAKSRLVFTRLTSPIAGTVLAVRKRVGERVRGPEFSEDVVMVVAPLDVMQVDLDVGELDVVHLKPGQRAEVRLRALGDGVISGKVEAVSLEANIRDRGLPSEVTQYKARVSLETPPAGLRPGMSASVTVITDARQGVLTVPFEAVGGGAGGLAVKERAYKVFAVEQGKVHAKPVQLGAVGEAEVELLGGLNEGETVITGPYEVLAQGLDDGVAVREVR